MGGKKRGASEALEQNPTGKQKTLAEVFSHQKAKADTESHPPPAFQEIEYVHSCVSEKLFSTARPLYDKYCRQSALMQGTPATDPTKIPKTNSKRAAWNETSLEAEDDTEEDDPGASSDPSWEFNGQQFVTALEPLVSPRRGLPRYLQEFLIHIVLNHERHRTNISLQALRLLLHNAKLHPPCSIPQGAPPGQLRANRELWVPGNSFQFQGSKCPPTLASKSALDFYLDLWSYAHQFSMASMEEAKSAKPVKDVPAGHILLLQYCTSLIRADLDLRLGLVRSPCCSGFLHAERVMKGSVLWQILSTGVGGGSVHLMWQGSSRNSIALLQSLVVTYLGSIKKPGQPRTSRQSSQAASQTPQKASATPQASTPYGFTTGLHKQQQPDTPLTIAELGSLASGTLNAWQQMYAEAERSGGELYNRTDRGTDHYFLSDALHHLFMGRIPNQEGNPLARKLDEQLKHEDVRLALLSTLAPETRLTLLGMEFSDMALNAWDAYAQSSSSKCVDNLKVHQLPSGLVLLRDFLDQKGKNRPGQDKVDPLQVLACLAPPDAVQAAAKSLPSLKSVVKDGVVDLYNQAKKKLMKIDTGNSKLCDGFTLWLGAFVRAAIEVQRATKAGSEEAAALRTLVSSLCLRMDQDSDSSFEDSPGSRLAKAAMQQAVGAC